MTRKQLTASTPDTVSTRSTWLAWSGAGLLAIALLLAPGGLPLRAQAPAAPAAGKGEENVSDPEVASYLERHHAIRAVDNLKDRTLEDIKRLKVLVGNFGGEVEGSQGALDTIRASYQEAEKERFRRRFVESLKLHQQAHAQIAELYQKFNDKYKEQVATLLAECAGKLVDEEFAQSGEPGQPGGGTTRIFLASEKLEIAYQQTALAEDRLRDNRPDAAITHYRLAKGFAIGVLIGLEEDTKKQEELEKKFERDLLDIRGLTKAEGSESKPAK